MNKQLSAIFAMPPVFNNQTILFIRFICNGVLVNVRFLIFKINNLHYKIYYFFLRLTNLFLRLSLLVFGFLYFCKSPLTIFTYRIFFFVLIFFSRGTNHRAHLQLSACGLVARVQLVARHGEGVLLRFHLISGNSSSSFIIHKAAQYAPYLALSGYMELPRCAAHRYGDLPSCM
jgi:hypothetical protein